MAIRQTRIFVASADPMDDWAETVIGRVIRPFILQYAASLQWSWFSRYVSPINDSGDCNIAAIPDEFKQPLQPGGQQLHRSVRFRFNVSNAQQEAFENQLNELLEDFSYRISDVRDYDYVADTGGHRFLGNENRQAGRDVQRADLVTQLYQAICRVVLDALVEQPNGRFRIETNDHQENPQHSTFESLHHLFCNITHPPLMALVYQNPANGQLALGTRWIPQAAPLNLLGELPLRF